jgi:hypothetical protein
MASVGFQMEWADFQMGLAGFQMGWADFQMGLAGFQMGWADFQMGLASSADFQAWMERRAVFLFSASFSLVY